MQLTQEEVRKYAEKNGLADPRPWPEVKEELDRIEERNYEARLDSVAGVFGFPENNAEEEQDEENNGEEESRNSSRPVPQDKQRKDE